MNRRDFMKLWSAAVPVAMAPAAWLLPQPAQALPEPEPTFDSITKIADAPKHILLTSVLVLDSVPDVPVKLYLKQDLLFSVDYGYGATWFNFHGGIVLDSLKDITVIGGQALCNFNDGQVYRSIRFESQ